MIIPNSVKVVFCNTSNAKCLVFEHQTARSDPKSIRKKTNLETNIKKYLSGPWYRKSFQDGVPKSKKKQRKSKPGPQTVLSWFHRFPAPRKPKWKNQAGQMICLGTKNAKISLQKCKKTCNLRPRSNGQGPSAVGVAHTMEP